MNEPLYNRQEQIQAYLSGRLSSTEKTVFEAELAQDTELAEEIQLYRRIRKTLAQKETFDFQEKLGTISQKVNLVPDHDITAIEAALKTSKWWQNGWLWGTLVALMLGGFLFLNNYALPPDTVLLKQISAEMITPFENVIAYNPDENSPVALGMSAYDKADYRQAIGQLQRAAANNPEIRFYLGVSQLLNKDDTQAIQTLEALQGEEVIFDEAVNFYLALAYLQVEKVAEAKALLLPLVSSSQFGNQTQRLLDAI